MVLYGLILDSENVNTQKKDAADLIEIFNNNPKLDLDTIGCKLTNNQKKNIITGGSGSIRWNQLKGQCFLAKNRLGRSNIKSPLLEIKDIEIIDITKNDTINIFGKYDPKQDEQEFIDLNTKEQKQIIETINKIKIINNPIQVKIQNNINSQRIHQVPLNNNTKPQVQQVQQVQPIQQNTKMPLANTLKFRKYKDDKSYGLGKYMNFKMQFYYDNTYYIIEHGISGKLGIIKKISGPEECIITKVTFNNNKTVYHKDDLKKFIFLRESPVDTKFKVYSSSLSKGNEWIELNNSDTNIDITRFIKASYIKPNS